MTHTQTITLPEFTPCVFSPAVFGASSSVMTSPVESGRTTSGPTSASVAAAPSSPPRPPGCVLWGPDDGGRYEYRSESNEFYWVNGASGWSPLTDSLLTIGCEPKSNILANPPTCPPPDYAPATKPEPKPQPDSDGTNPLPPSTARGEPKRYRTNLDGTYEEDPQAEWVKYSDYATLRSQLAGVERQNEAMRKAGWSGGGA